MNIIITGGGTGGHLSIAKALGVMCKKRDLNTFYIGSTSGQDRLWFEKSEIFSKSYFLQTTGIVNKTGFKKIQALVLMFKAILHAKKIIKENHINAVISVGGFSAGGASIAALLSKTPLFIHEQNAICGKLNAILTPFSKNIFGSFENDSQKFIKTSYPINEDFFTYARIRKTIKTILFLGGSQGAVAINNFALSICEYLMQKNIKIIHQCGKNDFERVKKEYAKRGITYSKSLDSPVCLFDFDNALIYKMKVADFCVSRAGASSIWELCANKLPSFFIPYPFAAKNHQYFNALFFKNLNLCEVVEQKDLNKEVFFKYLDSIDLESISNRLGTLISPNGANAIVNHIINNDFKK